MPGRRDERIEPSLKRVIDLVGAGLGLVALSPLLGWIAWRVRRDVGSPVLFRQGRPGLHGETFELVKFRTMRDARDATGHALPDEERLTDFGRWLRSTSLDELPELFNVLKGDMSLVGPRPLLTGYLPLYSPEQARRHEVRPGITGWSQVHGRNDMSWEDKLSLDVWYVDNRNLWLDARILLRTVWVTATRQGVSLAGHATTVPFTGHRSVDGDHDQSGCGAGTNNRHASADDEPGAGGHGAGEDGDGAGEDGDGAGEDGAGEHVVGAGEDGVGEGGHGAADRRGDQGGNR